MSGFRPSDGDPTAVGSGVHDVPSGDDTTAGAPKPLTIVLVDDNAPTLVQLQKVLESFEPRCEVRVASNGQEAISLLQSVPVDVLVTDLSMPFGDGFSLLTYVKRTRSNLPVMVVTGLAPTDYAARLDPFGSITVVAKPVDDSVLKRELARLIEESSTGELHGVTLAGFLQLISMERKSCSIRVRSGELLGRLHFKSGALVNAYTFDDDLEGEPAARRILSWTEVDIEVERSYHNHKQLIRSSLQTLLLASALEKDEFRELVDDDEPLPEPAAGSSLSRPMPTHRVGVATPADSLVFHDTSEEEAPMAKPGPEGTPRSWVADEVTSTGPPDPAINPVDRLWETAEDDELDYERELQMAVERLTSRARQLDDAVDGLMGEVGALQASRKRLKRLEEQERQRRKRLEELRDALSAAVIDLDETLG